MSELTAKQDSKHKQETTIKVDNNKQEHKADNIKQDNNKHKEDTNNNNNKNDKSVKDKNNQNKQQPQTQSKQQQQQQQQVTDNIDNTFQYEYQHIADKMLRQLQEEYWNVHKYNIKDSQPQTNMQEKQQQQINGNGDINDDDDQQVPEGYQNLDNCLDDNNINSDQDSQDGDSQGGGDNDYDEDEDDEEDGNKSDGNQHKPKQQQQVQKQQQSIAIHINTDINTLPQFQPQPQLTTNPQSLQLIQVGPVPQSVFEVPQHPIHNNINIDCDKIKCFALSLNIQTPDWAKDPQQLQSKIRKLFEKPIVVEKNNSNNNGNNGNSNKVGDFEKKKIDGY